MVKKFGGITSLVPHLMQCSSGGRGGGGGMLARGSECPLLSLLNETLVCLALSPLMAVWFHSIIFCVHDTIFDPSDAFLLLLSVQKNAIDDGSLQTTRAL